MIRTRFAPSPTGYLHAGHAHAARIAFEAGDEMLLRIEDIDRTRCRPEFDAAILEDLTRLGIRWTGPVWRQSQRFAVYQSALDRLTARGLLYPCFCTRRDIQTEIARATSAPHDLMTPDSMTPDGPRYPGTCRGLPPATVATRQAAGQPYALRLDMEAALAAVARPLWFVESGQPVEARPEMFGDVVLARKETPTSYHLAVTVDDAAQNITLVTRAADLLPATHLHRLLQALLDLPTPEYRHFPLLTGPDGQRLSKRDGARSLREIWAAGEGV